MKVTGFSFIKNAVAFQYPIVEAVRSILPLCDEVVIAVGDSTDGTRELVASIDPQKIKIIDTVWDAGLKEGGRVLAAETDKAFKAVGAEADWCIYIQGDEVLHERGYAEVAEAMTRWKDDKQVDGFLFNYLHFYGSFDHVGASSKWYKNEIRVVRNDRTIYSYRDAQGFRKGDNKKLKVKKLNAFIHHYGWVREPAAMQAKQNNFGVYYQNFGPLPDAEKMYTGDFDYSGIDALKKFTGTHPAVMQQRIAKMNWKFEHDLRYNKIKLKDRFKNAVEAITGKRPFDHNNYKII
ncbi:MAG TPA: glycosyltransferase family 2 protein [Flavisolibacter sp.]|nr:glycosyltransferase family 2 protein [Flavisolibacter sp.]